jgi:hypothetical protein
MIITKEMLFDNNVKQIIQAIETDYYSQIQKDFDTNPNLYCDFLTWLELHPEIVGKAFISHIINYGYTNEDIN